ncbi:unnamed protein product [Effrenium voratum]|nr:unnamed protein product [Effrenium voratum]
MARRCGLLLASTLVCDAFLQELLLANDECDQHSETCAQNALQRRALAHSQSEKRPKCQDVSQGSSCHEEAQWAQSSGIHEHPEWYPHLTVDSSLLDFQCRVYQSNPAKCPKPCSTQCEDPPPSHSPPVTPQQCVGHEDAKACLCIFDIDRTLTSKQGTQDTCGGSKAFPGIADSAYGGGELVLSQLAAKGLDGTFCSKCYVGICSHGDGTGEFSKERTELLKILNTEAMQKLVLKPQNAAWSDMKLLSPYVVFQPDAKKQEAVAQIIEWYASQEVCIQRENTYFFDDKDVNINPFRGTGINAHQVSCNSRDAILNWGEVGLCGATQEEIKIEKGVSVCQVDCQWTAWGAWNACSATCGGGQRSRRRWVAVKSANGGKDCENSLSTDVQECNLRNCPTTTTTTTTTTVTTEAAIATTTSAMAATNASTESTDESPKGVDDLLKEEDILPDLPDPDQ